MDTFYFQSVHISLINILVPNPVPNSDPNSVPNPVPNSVPNSDPNSDPNSKERYPRPIYLHGVAWKIYRTFC